MSNLRASVNIVETNAEIEGKILRALRIELNKYLEKIFNKIKSKISDAVINAIKSSPEYDSLINGDLKYEFGLPDSDSRVGSILEFWKKINTSYKSVTVEGNKLRGGFTINMIDSDYSDIIKSPAAIFITEKGSELNWLEWLLLFGNKTIIKDYTIEFGYNPRSRTGQAIMRGVKSGKWSVPQEFSGTKNNNWITRAIDTAEPIIYQILNEAMK